MRITTPRATPVAAAPVSIVSRSATRAEPGPELVGATLIVHQGGEYPLTDGSALIGRSQECDLRFDDPLISRLHARVRVEADRVGIEDLHSTNGVYVRGGRIARFVTLRHGDRAQLGTQELTFFAYREELAPESGVGQRHLVVPAAEPSLGLEALEPPKPIPTTTRAGALTMAGELARRFARDGRAEDGAKVLIPHLKRILRGATSGLEVPEALGEQAAALAMDVAVWTADAAWLDYVVELHIATKRLMTHSGILALQRAERWLGAIDRLLLQYYVETCTAAAVALSEDEQLRLRLLERLLHAKL